ncbi:MAG: hypothetical protein COX77_01910 [Candidatus Komeilibacteria bacterium CG_4_10_14_0_2_um_filter_37_10]|uniref:Radical SAM core domain-containing protein n=1 Tax=Candidatus Komeilibacteria bacterium CG_4_10_14_0_2_um_filter_37_10 TaxID=1974470 RepID=A0A2M7VFD9_9BACT|nr:MAG: hypothetical protein COX77_01910 [Candidatus Komeilibacteria bacterium CG_4_10_14_0_2_um_filter_37_10]
MGFETAKEAIDKYISLLRLHGKKDGAINFGGGEPLLNWKVIEMSLRYIKATYSDEFELRLTLNTNASLLTAEIAENLKRYGVEIASSLDGLAKANNLVRLTSSGEETFDLIVNGFRNLELVGYPIEGISITINERNFQYILTEIIDWAVERKMTDLRIDIDVVGAINIPVAEVADKLMLLWKYAKQRKIQIAGFWSRPYENLSLSVLTDDVGFCGGVKGNSICVSPSREIFMCGYSNTILGNLDSFGQSLLVDGTYYNLVKNRQTGQMKMCQDCPIECQCNGGCQITQEYAAEINSMKLDRMCELYKTMTYRLLLEQISTQL